MPILTNNCCSFRASERSNGYHRSSIFQLVFDRMIPGRALEEQIALTVGMNRYICPLSKTALVHQKCHL